MIVYHGKVKIAPSGPPATVHVCASKPLPVLEPCDYEGKVTERCRWGDEGTVRKCDHPKATWATCKRSATASNLAADKICGECGLHSEKEAETPPVTDELAPPVETILDWIRGPEAPRPDGWLKWPQTTEAHRILADELITDMPSCPPVAGRGVVIVGGGKYEVGIYIAVKMLRHVGCQLPVQVWHRGQSEPIGDKVRALARVEVIDLRSDPRAPASRRVDGGWQAKLDAIIGSGFKEALYLDADAYTVANPEPCFDHVGPGGIVCWPDCGTDHNIHWGSYGLSGDGAPPAIQGGHYVFDVERAWPAIRLAHHYDHHSEFYYQKQMGVGGYGDQDQTRAAIHRLHHPYTMFSQDSGLTRGVFVQRGPDGQPMFVHRCQSKLGRKGDFRRPPKRRNDLPLESVVWKLFSEAIRP